MAGAAADPAGTDNSEIDPSKEPATPQTDTTDIKNQEETNHDKNGILEEDEIQTKTNHGKAEQESKKLPQGELKCF